MKHALRAFDPFILTLLGRVINQVLLWRGILTLTKDTPERNFPPTSAKYLRYL